MAGSFKAEGEIQFQYSSLKSTFQELNPEHSSSPEPASSSDDFILDTTPSHSALPKPVPELVPNAPPPDPPARRSRQPPPPPPPCAPSSHHIYRKLDHQTLSHFQQTVLMPMLSQMLSQGEHLPMRNLTIRSLQILHMEKNQ